MSRDDARMSIHLKPRNPWEAMDLGIRFVQRWWRPIFTPWLLYVSLLFITLHLAIPDNALLPQLVFWWLKPLHDRVLLFSMQKALLDQPATLTETLHALPSLLKNGLFLNLTLLRLDPARSFHLPIWQLEGLQGKPRRRRVKALGHRNNRYGFWLTLACLIVEWSFYLSPVLVVFLLLPAQLDFKFESLLTSQTGFYWLDIIDSLSFVAAIAIVEPFYVAAGFMLYINRRVQLEAWDTEWRFRRLSARHGSPAVLTLMLVGIILLSMGTSPRCYATEQASHLLPGDRADDIIEKVLSRDDLKTWKMDEEWTFNFGHSDQQHADAAPGWGKWIGALLARLIRLLMWLGLAILLVYLFVTRDRWLEWSGITKRRKAPQPPETIAGLPVTVDSLPPDIPASARAALDSGEPREALSLLYRGAILTMLQRDRLPLQSYHTEGDVLQLAEKKLAAPRTRYLRRLTNHWQALAWGHEPPEEDCLLTLCSEWPRYFGTTTLSEEHSAA